MTCPYLLGENRTANCCRVTSLPLSHDCPLVQVRRCNGEETSDYVRVMKALPPRSPFYIQLRRFAMKGHIPMVPYRIPARLQSRTSMKSWRGVSTNTSLQDPEPSELNHWCFTTAELFKYLGDLTERDGGSNSFCGPVKLRMFFKVFLPALAYIFRLLMPSASPPEVPDSFPEAPSAWLVLLHTGLFHMLTETSSSTGL